jgi:methylglyoxal synthase
MAQSKGCNETKEDVMTRSIAASKTGERVFSKKTDSGRVMRLLLHPLGGDETLRAKISNQFMKEWC